MTLERMKEQPEYILHLRPMPNSTWTPEQRLKRILKTVLRVYQMKAVSCREVPNRKQAKQSTEPSKT